MNITRMSMKLTGLSRTSLQDTLPISLQLDGEVTKTVLKTVDCPSDWKLETRLKPLSEYNKLKLVVPFSIIGENG